MNPEPFTYQAEFNYGEYRIVDNDTHPHPTEAANHLEGILEDNGIPTEDVSISVIRFDGHGNPKRKWITFAD